MLSGMDGFDAINHAFAAISTEGFSTRPESIGYWNSHLVEGVTVVLMLLGTMNFVTGLRPAWVLRILAAYGYSFRESLVEFVSVIKDQGGTDSLRRRF